MSAAAVLPPAATALRVGQLSASPSGTGEAAPSHAAAVLRRISAGLRAGGGVVLETTV